MIRILTPHPGQGFRLPHRVEVRLVRSGASNLAAYHCPGCTRRWNTNRGLVADLAYWHAASCNPLRALNRAALACWNCDGTGRLASGGRSAETCLVCLGRGWTTEPDPTTSKERTR